MSNENLIIPHGEHRGEWQGETHRQRSYPGHPPRWHFLTDLMTLLPMGVESIRGRLASNNLGSCLNLQAARRCPHHPALRKARNAHRAPLLYVSLSSRGYDVAARRSSVRSVRDRAPRKHSLHADDRKPANTHQDLVQSGPI